MRAAGLLGLVPGGAEQTIGEEVLAAAVIAAACPQRSRARGQGWARCEAHREFIAAKLTGGVRLSKIRRLLIRSGAHIPYPTLHRFAISELEYGRRGQVTMPVVDGEPGSEVQLDTGWVITLAPDEHGRRRKMKAWIFTPVLSRYRFVYPVQHETTGTAIEACEAAWDFYGGVFGVVIPDNTSAIINRADPLGATINTAFLEYSQSRGFVIDPARVRRAKDKGRVERSVRDVRDDCYAGETSRDAFEILTERHRAGSIVITSNRDPAEWHALFADPLRAQAAIDRFASASYDLTMEGESYRARQKPRLDRSRTGHEKGA